MKEVELIRGLLLYAVSFISAGFTHKSFVLFKRGSFNLNRNRLHPFQKTNSSMLIEFIQILTKSQVKKYYVKLLQCEARVCETLLCEPIPCETILCETITM